MHVLFVHKSFPAQFGHIASYLVKHRDIRCTFVCEEIPGQQPAAGYGMTAGPTGRGVPSQNIGGIEVLQYQIQGGATQSTHYTSRTFENTVWHSHAVFEAMKSRPDIQPDLVVGHSGFGSTLFLADLYTCPIINYFEYYYYGRDSDMDFRPEFPPSEMDVLRARVRNGMIHLDLHTCAAGYSPTHWQRSLFPAEYQYKIATIFDGIDRDVWHRRPTPRRIGNGPLIPPETRIVTYVSRGLESMRGFDIFMRVAKRICDARKDVIFIVVGSDRVCYGGDLRHIQAKTFREHVLAQDQYDLGRFLFTGPVPPLQLVDLFNISDLHIYLTVPFVLSWSLMDALACGCTVLGSDTAPVREVIRHEENGLLAGFFDVDGLTREALRVLADPEQYRPLGQAGIRLIEEQYSLEKKLPEMLDLYERTLRKAREAPVGSREPPRPGVG
jgi:glycosyltransferase involved in cell wall biosynthesis